jgi:ribose 5-phosphate isomerase A
MTIDEQKRLTGEAAAALVEDGMTVGLGTGSTAAFLIKALGARAKTQGMTLRCVATSRATEIAAEAVGLSLFDLNDAGPIDLTIDGADEVGPGLALIKGGGAALLREKLVWEASRRNVVIADAAKMVVQLGAFALPVEVVTFGHATTRVRIAAVLADCGILAEPVLRLKDGAPLRTDNGNLIYDIPCGVIPDAPRLAAALKPLTGVVDHGLFLGLADEALIGTDKGVQRLRP